MREKGADSLTSEAELRRRLEEVRREHPTPDPAALAEVVRAVLDTMTGDLTAQEASLLVEVEALGRTIAEARAEIAALQVDDITESHIPNATDELDAVVSHTALATDRILTVCETLDEVASRLAGEETGETLLAATTQIYEACSFQDITGQRISKVISALKAIDAKVTQIVARFSARQANPWRPGGVAPGGGGSGGGGSGGALTAGSFAAVSFAPAVPGKEPSGVSMHGPQLPTAAMGQNDIDELLASFE